MVKIKAKLIYNKRISAKFLHLAIEAPRIAKKALPGQFVNIRLTDTCEPLLRRPFSIHRVKGRNIEIIYEVVGKGTQILSQRKAGEYLDVIGPLGKGFDYKSPSSAKILGGPANLCGGHQVPPKFLADPPIFVAGTKSLLLVAGGIGVAPLIFLAEKLAEIQNPKSKIQNIVLIGAKTKNDILCEKEFKQLGCDVKTSTDDGSRGFKGKVTDLLKNILRANGQTGKRATLYACGPKPMLKEIALLSKKYNISAQVSLEEHMACGFGACLGCVVNTKEGYKRVCKEGPVLEASQIIWKE